MAESQIVDSKTSLESSITNKIRLTIVKVNEVKGKIN